MAVHLDQNLPSTLAKACLTISVVYIHATTEWLWVWLSVARPKTFCLRVFRLWY